MGSTAGGGKTKRPATTRKKAKTRGSMSSEEAQRSPGENRNLKWKLQTQKSTWTLKRVIGAKDSLTISCAREQICRRYALSV